MYLSLFDCSSFTRSRSELGSFLGSMILSSAFTNYFARGHGNAYEYHETLDLQLGLSRNGLMYGSDMGNYLVNNG